MVFDGEKTTDFAGYVYVDPLTADSIKDKANRTTYGTKLVYKYDSQGRIVKNRQGKNIQYKVRDFSKVISEDWRNDIGEGTDVYALRYTEFIAPMVKAIQELDATAQTPQAVDISNLNAVTMKENVESVAATAFWATGYNTGKVYKYDANWNYSNISIDLMPIYNSAGTIHWGSSGPRDIAYDANLQKWYILDVGYSARVYRMKLDWTYDNFWFATHDPAPNSLEVDSDGNLYVAGGQAIVYKYNASGTNTEYFNLTAQGTIQIQGIRKGSNGKWYTLVAGKVNEYTYDAAYTWTYTRNSWSTKYTINGVVYGNNPYGLVELANGDWAITDINHDTINIYSSSFIYKSSSPHITQDDLNGDSVITGIESVGGGAANTITGKGKITLYTTKEKVYAGQPVALDVSSGGPVTVKSVDQNTKEWQIAGIALADIEEGYSVEVLTEGYTTVRTTDTSGTIGNALYINQSDYTKTTITSTSTSIKIGTVMGTNASKGGIYAEIIKPKTGITQPQSTAIVANTAKISRAIYWYAEMHATHLRQQGEASNTIGVLTKSYGGKPLTSKGSPGLNNAGSLNGSLGYIVPEDGLILSEITITFSAAAVSTSDVHSDTGVCIKFWKQNYDDRKALVLYRIPISSTGVGIENNLSGKDGFQSATKETSLSFADKGIKKGDIIGWEFQNFSGDNTRINGIKNLLTVIKLE